MTYDLSAEQYQRGVNHLAAVQIVIAQGGFPAYNTSVLLGMAEMLAHLADCSVSRVMRDRDARLASLGSLLPDCAV